MDVLDQAVQVMGAREMALSRHGEILVPPCGISTPPTSQNDSAPPAGGMERVGICRAVGLPCTIQYRACPGLRPTPPRGVGPTKIDPAWRDRRPIPQSGTRLGGKKAPSPTPLLPERRPHETRNRTRWMRLQVGNLPCDSRENLPATADHDPCVQPSFVHLFRTGTPP